VNLSLRQATANDSALIAAIIRSVFEEYRGLLVPPSGAHKETAETIATKIAKGGGILAYAGDAAGCVVYYPEGDSMYLGRLAVIPAYRNQGVGKALVEAVEEQAKAAGFKRMRLGVRISLPGNRVFFERLGYTVTSYESHEGYSEPTFMILHKSLG
jgi:GNAT superfamily N-acetyltransferase